MVNSATQMCTVPFLLTKENEDEQTNLIEGFPDCCAPSFRSGDGEVMVIETNVTMKHYRHAHMAALRNTVYIKEKIMNIK